MSLHSCRRCGYTSNIKTHLKKHYKRRHTCVNLLNGPSASECLEELYSIKPEISQKCDSVVCTISAEMENPNKESGSDNAVKTHLTAKDCEFKKIDCEMTASLKKLTANDCEMTVNDCEGYICQFCNKVFTRKNNMVSHMKKTCKYAAKTYTEHDVNSILDASKRQIDDSKRQIEAKDRQLKDKDDLLVEMRKQIEILLTKVGNNNNNVNIVLNGFGQEDTSYISGSFIKSLIKEGPYKCIPNLIKNIHFHPEHMENCNIKIPNMNKNIAKIYNGDNKRWELQNKTDTLLNMSDKAYNMINEHYDDGSDSTMDKFNEEFDENKQETSIKLKEGIELTILNNQDSV